MKNLILLLTFIMMTLGASYSIAQSNILLASNMEVPKHIDRNPFAIDEIDFSHPSTSNRYDIPESASYFQMNTSTSQLNINVKGDVKYTTAELLRRDTNTTAQTVQLIEGKNSLDLSDTDTGTYYMILSNKEGDILSEIIIVI